MMLQKLSLRIADFLTAPAHLKTRLFVEGLVIGTLTGLLIASLRYILSLSEHFLPIIYQKMGKEPVLLVPWLLAFLTIAWILGQIVKKEPMTSGSGIPQIEGILAGKMSMEWARVLVLKYVGAILGIGAGLSLGREGPSVQLGACIGQGFGRMTNRSYEEGRYLLVTGAGAGLAAAFNAPLAGAVFAFEELTHDFSPYVLMGAAAAAIMSTTMTQQFLGMDTIFQLGAIPAVDAGAHLLLLAALGLFIGLVALAFNPALIWFLEWNRKIPIPAWEKAFLPLAFSILLGFTVPSVLGGGSPLVDSLVTMPHSVTLLLVLFIAKFVFTMSAFGSGVPGGIFLPMLVLGALAGAIFATVGEMAGLLPDSFAVCCIVYAMAGYFAAVVKAPITGVLLIMEMTGSFAHLLPLMIVAMVAYLVADMAGSEPVYEMLLKRNLALRERAEKVFRAKMAEEKGKDSPQS